MDERDNRVRALREIVDRFPSIAEFARRYDLDATYMSQLLNGHRSMGEKTARNLEQKLGLARGAFDAVQTQRQANGQSQRQTLGPNVEPGPRIAGYVPLISWVAAGVWTPIAESEEVEAWLPSPHPLSPRAFALRVRGISMEPLFQAGDIIFVDPEAAADHKRYVVVRLDDEAEATFKQLIIEGPRRYLKALNPAWPDPIIEINGDCTLIGVAVGKWVSL